MSSTSGPSREEENYLSSNSNLIEKGTASNDNEESQNSNHDKLMEILQSVDLELEDSWGFEHQTYEDKQQTFQVGHLRGLIYVYSIHTAFYGLKSLLHNVCVVSIA